MVVIFSPPPPIIIIIIICYCYYYPLFEKQAEIWRALSLPKCWQPWRLAHTEARSQELNQDLSCEWQGSLHLLTPRAGMSRKLEWRMELGLKARHSKMA